MGPRFAAWVRRFGPDFERPNLWHGTPHVFEPTPGNPLGEFDLSKMGTGEGAQARGWGNYLAEARPVGQEYRDRLAKSQIPTTFKTPQGEITIEEVLDNLYKQDQTKFYDLSGNIRYGMANYKNDPAYLETLLKELPFEVDPVKGALYNARLHVPREMILDLDKPLNMQADILEALARGTPKVQRATDQILSANRDRPGEDLYTKLEESYGGLAGRSTAPRMASEALGESGIPGSRFLDKDSRNLNPAEELLAEARRAAATHGNGTEEEVLQFLTNRRNRKLELDSKYGKGATVGNLREIDDAIRYMTNPPKKTQNFVVWDPSYLEIFAKWGIPPAAAAAIFSPEDIQRFFTGGTGDDNGMAA